MLKQSLPPLSCRAPPDLQATLASSREPSILRDDRPAEFEVQAQRYNRIGIVHGVGNLAVERSETLVPAKIVVAIFELADQIVGQRVGNPAAGSDAASVSRELIDAKYGIGVGMLEIAVGPAAGEEQQQAVDGDAASRTKRGAVPKAGRVDPADRKRTGVERTDIAALDAGPESVCFDTQHDDATLPTVSGFSAG